VADQVREGERVQRAPAGIDARLGRRRADAAELVGVPFVATRRPLPRPVQRRSRGADLIGAHMAGDDFLAAGTGPRGRMSRPVELSGGPGDDVLRGGRSGTDRLRP
jgi:hypothetical protein